MSYHFFFFFLPFVANFMTRPSIKSVIVWYIHHYVSAFIFTCPLTVGSLGHHWWFHDQFPPFFSVLQCPLGLGELQACPFPDAVFPLLPLFAFSYSSFQCALQNSFGRTWWTGDKYIPLQFESLYDGQEVFVWSDLLLDLGTDFLVGNAVFV